MKNFRLGFPLYALIAGLACAPSTSAAEGKRHARTPSPAASQTASDFEWEGRLADGKTLQIHNVAGDVKIIRAKGSKTRVTARKSGRDASRVTITVQEQPGGLLIAPEYPKHSGDRGGDARIDFVVELPSAVALRTKLVSGDVSAKNVGSKLELETVSGNVDVSGSGDVSVQTVSGNATVALAKTATRARLGTVNGRLEVRLPTGLGAHVDAATLNGRIKSDFPADRRKQMVGEKATIDHGDGAAKVSLESVNGGISIKKS